MKNNKYILLLIAFSFLSACKKKDDTNPYFTFGVVGNEWVYSSSNNPYNCTYKITDETDDKCTLTQTYNNPSQSTYAGYWLVSDTAFGIYFDRNSKKVTILEYNSEVGDVYYNIAYSDTSVYEVMSTSKNVTVPAGDFECYELKTYKIDSPSDYQTMYIDKKNGLIKTTNENGQLHTQLISKNF